MLELSPTGLPLLEAHGGLAIIVTHVIQDLVVPEIAKQLGILVIVSATRLIPQCVITNGTATHVQDLCGSAFLFPFKECATAGSI